MLAYLTIPESVAKRCIEQLNQARAQNPHRVAICLAVYSADASLLPSSYAECKSKIYGSTLDVMTAIGEFAHFGYDCLISAEV